jgi:hypothetical protein
VTISLSCQTSVTTGNCLYLFQAHAGIATREIDTVRLIGVNQRPFVDDYGDPDGSQTCNLSSPRHI